MAVRPGLSSMWECRKIQLKFANKLMAIISSKLRGFSDFGCFLQVKWCQLNLLPCVYDNLARTWCILLLFLSVSSVHFKLKFIWFYKLILIKSSEFLYENDKYILSGTRIASECKNGRARSAKFHLCAKEWGRPTSNFIK